MCSLILDIVSTELASLEILEFVDKIDLLLFQLWLTVALSNRFVEIRKKRPAIFK